ncbi:thioredoxin domain-containing protein [Geofilum sp. OHC36d9]|uniref:thioredoxin domain-containing protein n=1 Tax=Geofilum sp. OHC36d9 TaxID=3458413 RepID=UPI0040337B1F
MKNTFLAFLIVFFVVGAGVSDASNNGNEAILFTSGADEGEAAVIPLDEAGFIEHVFDYKNNSEWKYKGDKPAIIDFYAEWCGPCKRLSPVLAELQREYGGKIQVYKIDAEKNRELAAAFGVSAYPTMLFIPMNSDPAGARGLLPKEELVRLITDFLKVEK